MKALADQFQRKRNSAVANRRDLGNCSDMQVSHDNKSFTLISRHWTGTYPIEELLVQLALYRRAQELFPKSANQYNEAVAALEKLAKQIGA